LINKRNLDKCDSVFLNPRSQNRDLGHPKFFVCDRRSGESIEVESGLGYGVKGFAVQGGGAEASEGLEVLR
jgi:hypothetical protein